jgi:hypothetical protein
MLVAKNMSEMKDMKGMKAVTSGGQKWKGNREHT